MKISATLIMILIRIGGPLLGNVVHQPPTTPQQEEKIIYSHAKKPIAPLSVALKDLIQGILDQTFDQKFLDKIAELEKKKFTGDFVDTWENGQAKIKASFKEGKVDGHVHGWFPDGLEAFKAFFYENKKVGIHMVFYPKGGPRVASERIARLLQYNFDGQLDGKQFAEYPLGFLKAMVRYKQDVLDGRMGLYDSERKCIKEAVYKYGKLISDKKQSSK